MNTRILLVSAALAAAFLTSAGGALAQTSGATSSTGVPTSYCAITRNLSRGASSASVAALQDYLFSRGYFTGASIGIFGPATLRAVVALQRAEGLPQTGFVGPLTRAIIARNCTSASQTSNVTIYSITPRQGPIGTVVTIDGFGFTNDNTIHFGSGVIVHVPITSSIAIACTTDPNCKGGIHQSLTFTVPSGLNPACFYSNPRCMVLTRLTTPGQYAVSVENQYGTSNSATFTVTGSGVSTAPHINTISPAQGGIGTSVTLTGTGFTQDQIVRFAEGSVSHTTSVDGTQITFTVPQAVGPYCAPQMMCAMYARLIQPGDYSVSVQNEGGTIVSNAVTFTVSGSSPTALSITGLDAPTQLALGQSGTWTVHVGSTSLNQNLHYAVLWGDEVNTAQASIMAPQPSTVQTSTTFTHAYQHSGTYTVQFTVTDDSGHAAMTSATIVVTPLY